MVSALEELASPGMIWELILLIKIGIKELLLVNGSWLPSEISSTWQIKVNETDAICEFIIIQQSLSLWKDKNWHHLWT
jgi:hypothetical protein